MRPLRTLLAAVILPVGLLLVSCGGADSNTAATPTTTTAATTTTPIPASSVLRILVSNDDGVGAPGIDAVVEALRALPETEVTVVAPATNQSGTGGKTSGGTLAATDATTASGFAAKAVAGFPADTIAWAIDQKGIVDGPDLVVSGINFGQNVGSLASVSGTVGAAEAAAARGIPALAASQGIAEGALTPNFPDGVKQVLDWVAARRDELAGTGANTSSSQPADAFNLNVPTCPTGAVRGLVTEPLAAKDDRKLNIVDCASTKTSFTDDVDAFVNGYAVIAPLPAS